MAWAAVGWGWCWDGQSIRARAASALRAFNARHLNIPMVELETIIHYNQIHDDKIIFWEASRKSISLPLPIRRPKVWNSIEPSRDATQLDAVEISLDIDAIDFFHVMNPFTVLGKPTKPIAALPELGIDVMVMPAFPINRTVEAALRTVVLDNKLSLSIQDSAVDSDTAAERMSFEHRGIEYDLWPSVVIPTYFCNWEYINFLRYLIGEKQPQRILDIFSGSGVIGLSLAKETGVPVDFADVNFWAIRSTRSTSVRNGIKIGDTMVSEGLRGIPADRKYDLIVGNPPHHHGVPDTEKALPGFDPDFSIHREFFEGAERVLSDHGAIVFIEYAGSSVLSDVYRKLPAGLEVAEVRHQKNGMWYTVEVRRRAQSS